MKEVLLGKTLAELQAIALQNGLPAYAGKQLAQWIYQKRVTDFEAMTNLSKSARAALSERYEVGRTAPVEAFTSRDGTRKYLFPTRVPGKYIETVMIPQYEDTIKYITMKLDENERSSTTRLMKIKDMMLQEAHHYQ